MKKKLNKVTKCVHQRRNGKELCGLWLNEAEISAKPYDVHEFCGSCFEKLE